MASLFTNQVVALRTSLYVILKRNIGISAVLLQKAKDPIQQLFVDKIREYSQKSKAAGGKMIDITPDAQKEIDDQLDRVKKQYGMIKGVDPTKLPDFSFKDPTIDPINMDAK